MAERSVFRRRQRRLLRPVVPRTENLAFAIIGLALAGVIAWVFAQRDAYDPGMRDLDPELLSRDGPKIQLYNQPLKPWVEPGSEQRVAAAPALGPFPDSLVADDWALAGRIRSFNADNLYEKINGEAEKFLKQGFQSLHYAVIRAPDGTELSIELYDQGNLGGSLGIFADHTNSSAQLRESAGVSYFLTSVGVIGRMGQYFFRAAADRSTDVVTLKSQQLAASLAELVGGRAAVAAPAPQSTQPTAGADELKVLVDALGVGESDVAFEAENAFQFDFAKAFWFARTGDDARVFVHRAADADRAQAMFKALLEELSFDFQMVQRNENEAVLVHEFLKTWFELRLSAQYVIGIENAKDADEARAAVDKLAAVTTR
ncbi:MAG: DUF6599 family protein [Gammaproteobacteria bacterium]